jgi:hypothetical protein
MIINRPSWIESNKWFTQKQKSFFTKDAIEEIILKLKNDEITQTTNVSVSMKVYLNHCTSSTNLHPRTLNKQKIVSNDM